MRPIQAPARSGSPSSGRGSAARTARNGGLARCSSRSAAPHPLTGRQAPITLGHEVAGRVADPGPGVSGLRAGDLVALDANLTAERAGGAPPSAHAVRDVRRDRAARGRGPGRGRHGPAAMCLPVAESVGADSAALAEPLSVAVRGFRRGRLMLDESVAIFGGGMIGIAAPGGGTGRCGAGLVVVVDPLHGAARVGHDAGRRRRPSTPRSPGSSTSSAD